MKKKINLHMHTTFSDGKIDIERMVQKLQENGVDFFSITDHDSVKSIEYLEHHMPTIPYFSGVELTAYLDKSVFSFSSDHAIHILAYDFDVETMRNYLLQWKEMRKSIVQNYIAVQNQNGMDFPAISSRSALANKMVEKGIVQTFIDGILRINMDTDYRVCVPTTSDVLQAIKTANGISVWAHPYKVLYHNIKIPIDAELVEHMITPLSGFGLNGLEVEYSCYEVSRQEILKRLCMQNRLWYSIGSDYHGKEGNLLYVEAVLECNCVVNQLANRQKSGTVVLTGGRSTENVLKRGEIVFRPQQAGDDLMIRFLQFLESKAFCHGQKYIRSENGQNLFAYISGFVPNDIGRTTQAQLHAFMKIVRDFHDLSAEFTQKKNTVICHNDLSPCNTVFKDGIPIAIIDWDGISEGERWEDVTYILWLWINIGSHTRDSQNILKQLESALMAYGADDKIKQNFTDKLIWRMEKAIADMSKDNPQYDKTADWVVFSKKWVLDNTKQIQHITG